MVTTMDSTRVRTVGETLIRLKSARDQSSLIVAALEVSLSDRANIICLDMVVALINDHVHKYPRYGACKVTTHQ